MHAVLSSAAAAVSAQLFVSAQHCDNAQKELPALCVVRVRGARALCVRCCVLLCVVRALCVRCCALLCGAAAICQVWSLLRLLR